MMFQSVVGLLFGAVPLATAAAVVGSQCAADNCLRGLRSPSKLEQARNDCSNWLGKTETASSVTVTEYSTIHSTTTLPSTVTQDKNIEKTATVTVSDTSTVVVPTTSTLTRSPGSNQAKRSAQPAIPAYASACSAASRYSSACSCISVTPETTTLAAATTTTTILETAWRTETEIEYTTREVESIVATTSTTTLIATQTVTSAVATATVTSFYMTIDDDYGKWYINVVSNREFPRLTQSTSQASKFELHDDGTVWVGSRILLRYAGEGLGIPRLLPPSFMSQAQYGTFTCGISSASAIHCQIPGNPANLFGTTLWSPQGELIRADGAPFWHGTAEEFTSKTSESVNGEKYIPVVMVAVATV